MITSFNSAVSRSALLTACAAIACSGWSARAASPDELAASANRQQEIRGQTQTVTQQIDSVVGEFDANGLSGGDDVKTLRAIKSMLGTLSEEQMQQVVHLLLQARDEQTPDAASVKVSDAYARQTQIIAQLRALLVEYQRDQAKVALSNKLKQLADRQNENLKGIVRSARRSLGDNKQKQSADHQDALQAQQSEQSQIKGEVMQATADLKALADNSDDKRLNDAAAEAEDEKVADIAASAAEDLNDGHLLKAASAAKAARDQLRDLARRVAPQSDKATQLAKAAQELDQQIQQQKQIVADADKMQRQYAASNEQKQEDVEDQADATAKDLVDVSPAATDHLKDAHDAMQQVRQALGLQHTEQAAKGAQTALQDLQQARSDLGRQMEQLVETPATQKDLATRAADLNRQQQELAQRTADRETPNDQLSAQQAKLAEQTHDLQADASTIAPDAVKPLDSAAEHMNNARTELSKNRKAAAADEQQQAATDLATAREAIDQAAKATEQTQEDLSKTETARDQVASAMDKQAQAMGETAAGQLPQAVAAGAQQQAADSAKRADQAMQQIPADAAQAAAQPLADAQINMQQAKSDLTKGDASAAQQPQREALAKLQQAKATLDQKIGQLQQKLGQPLAGEDAQAAADKVADQLKVAAADVNKAQGELAKGDQGNKEAAKDLAQAEADAAKAAADDKGVLGESGRQAMQQVKHALQEGETQAKDGNGQQASQDAQQANTAMANVMMTMGMAAAQAKAGQPQMQGQSQAPIQGPADEKASSDFQQPPKATGPNTDPKEASAGADGNPQGARADAHGNGQYMGLPPRDRQAVLQSQGEKYPQEYGSMVEQYYRNLSDVAKVK